MRIWRAHVLWAALAVLSIGTTAAVAAAPPAGAVPSGSAGLSAVSCPRSSWCMAVGSYVDRSQVRHALALEWNGQTWRELRNPPGAVLKSVSCSSASFCMARSGLAGRTEVWNGVTWRTIANPTHAATAPSCGSRSLCMLINGRGVAHSGSVVESWNGSRWRTWWQKTSLCPSSQGPCFMSDVSCGSATTCVAVGALTMTGGSEQVVIGLRWHRTKWGRFEFPLPFAGNPAAAYQVSCTTLCMAVGGAYSDAQTGDIAAAATWDGKSTSWTDASPNLGVITCGNHGYQPCGWTKSISCGSPTNCMALTFMHGNMVWNGTTWSAAPFAPAGTGAALGAVSCHRALCMAVGHTMAGGVRSTLAEIWNGAAWKVAPTPR